METTSALRENTAPRFHDIEDLARALENMRGMLCPILCPQGDGGRTEKERARYTLQAEAYKACAASLKAAASALRVYQAQLDMAAVGGADHE